MLTGEEADPIVISNDDEIGVDDLTCIPNPNFYCIRQKLQNPFVILFINLFFILILQIIYQLCQIYYYFL